MLYLLTIIPLAVMMLSDWKTRTVSILWLSVFFVSVACCSIFVNGLLGAAIYMAMNLTLLLIIGLALYAYSAIRKKRLGEMIGVGDALFFASLTPIAEPEIFIKLLVGMLIFSLLSWLILRKKLNPGNIPLVTFSGLPLIGIIVYKMLA